MFRAARAEGHPSQTALRLAALVFLQRASRPRLAGQLQCCDGS